VKVAVVGHAEWAEFVEAERVPAAGEIVEADEITQLAAGGGAVAAVQIAKLNGNCSFFTALGDDDVGDRIAPLLEKEGVVVHAARRPVKQRRAFVCVDSSGERTITTIGERLAADPSDDLPWADFDGVDSVYFTAGTPDALRAARGARFVVATVRAGAALADAGVEVDVLVASANDRGEQYERGDFAPVPRWVVRTEGALGGSLESAGGEVTRWRSLPVSGPAGDNYGAGDSFAAGLTCGLGMGYGIEDAISLGAFCGASAVHASGPYGSQASAADLAHWRELYDIST
jgi:ribokinase